MATLLLWANDESMGCGGRVCVEGVFEGGRFKGNLFRGILQNIATEAGVLVIL